MTGTRKGVYIGLGLVGVAVIFFVIRRRATGSSSNATPGITASYQSGYNQYGPYVSQSITSNAGGNPNLLMVSSAYTNVNDFQNSSYLQALAAESNLSAALAKLQARLKPAKPNTVGPATPASGSTGGLSVGSPTNIGGPGSTLQKATGSHTVDTPPRAPGTLDTSGGLTGGTPVTIMPATPINPTGLSPIHVGPATNIAA